MEHTQNHPTPVKHKEPFTHAYELRLINQLVPHLPRFLNGKNLTYATIVWSALVLLCSWIWRGDHNVLWIISAFIVAQYLTDSLDGAVGRYQKSGLEKWGYVMDHFLDFIFICSVVVAYTLTFPQYYLYLIIILATIASLHVATYLRASATGKYRMSYFRIGQSEFRLIIILQNILAIVFGASWFHYILIFNILVLFYVMCWAVYRAQNEAGRLDKLSI